MKLGITLLVIGGLACLEGIFTFGLSFVNYSYIGMAGAVIRLGIFGFMAYYGFKRIKKAKAGNKPAL